MIVRSGPGVQGIRLVIQIVFGFWVAGSGPVAPPAGVNTCGAAAGLGFAAVPFRGAGDEVRSENYGPHPPRPLHRPVRLTSILGLVSAFYRQSSR